ncbi:MAG TPA: hypothetical protein VJT74_01735 [Pyrinomonadaceae bacterium]|nr:hypothetical protein [Pyrinomonadaceae bacterium]
MKKSWVLTQEAFDRLLASFDADREQAGRQYERVRLKLVKYFEWRGAAFPDNEADETINRVARKITEGTKVDNLNAYFYGVARLVLAEALKGQEKEQTAFDEAVIMEMPSPMDEDSDLDQRRDCLDKCLQRLPRESRDLIVEYYQGERGKKIGHRKGIAARLGIPLNALRIRTHRIRAGLEACVQECLASQAA